MVLLIPVVAAVVGALVYALAANPKLQELGRLAYACGLLVALFGAGGEALRLLK